MKQTNARRWTHATTGLALALLVGACDSGDSPDPGPRIDANVASPGAGDLGPDVPDGASAPTPAGTGDPEPDADGSTVLARLDSTRPAFDNWVCLGSSEYGNGGDTSTVFQLNYSETLNLGYIVTLVPFDAIGAYATGDPDLLPLVAIELDASDESSVLVRFADASVQDDWISVRRLDADDYRRVDFTSSIFGSVRCQIDAPAPGSPAPQPQPQTGATDGARDARLDRLLGRVGFEFRPPGGGRTTTRTVTFAERDRVDTGTAQALVARADGYRVSCVASAASAGRFLCRGAPLRADGSPDREAVRDYFLFTLEPGATGAVGNHHACAPGRDDCARQVARPAAAGLLRVSID